MVLSIVEESLNKGTGLAMETSVAYYAKPWVRIRVKEMRIRAASKLSVFFNRPKESNCHPR